MSASAERVRAHTAADVLARLGSAYRFAGSERA